MTREAAENDQPTPPRYSPFSGLRPRSPGIYPRARSARQPARGSVIHSPLQASGDATFPVRRPAPRVGVGRQPARDPTIHSPLQASGDATLGVRRPAPRTGPARQLARGSAIPSTGTGVGRNTVHRRANRVAPAKDARQHRSSTRQHPPGRQWPGDVAHRLAICPGTIQSSLAGFDERSVCWQVGRNERREFGSASG
jgi:hypothetical protein